jgi:hypothetical protein
MPKAEVYAIDEKRDLETLLFEVEFAFLPRVGETISRDVGRYFSCYEVLKTWHREEGQIGIFLACASVKLDD